MNAHLDLRQNNDRCFIMAIDSNGTGAFPSPRITDLNLRDL